METATKSKIVYANRLLIDAAKCKEVPRLPVWMMRQAGRYLPEYREIRKNYTFLELCKDVKAAAAVSLQPLERLGVDAVIMFSDILVIPEAMGAAITFELPDEPGADKTTKKKSGGPKFLDPIRTPEQVDKLIVPDIEKSCDYVYSILRQLKSELSREVKVEDLQKLLSSLSSGELTEEQVTLAKNLGVKNIECFLQNIALQKDRIKTDIESLKSEDKVSLQEVPLIGFAGAPWTLASYMIEGGGSKDFSKIKSFMYQQRESMHNLLKKLSETVSKYLVLKIENGADMVQLFDTWASQMSRDDYEEFAKPYQEKIIANIKAAYPNTPVALYVNGVSTVIDYMKISGADVLGVDWRIDLSELRSSQSGFAIQGNFDPCYLLGTKEEVIERAKAMLQKAGTKPGYIANLGHGILPSVPVENAQAFIETVKKYS